MVNLRMNCLSALLLALIVLAAPLSVLAQDPLTEHYTSISGALSFFYPAGWVLNDDNDMISLTNDAAALYADVVPPGTVGIIIFEPAALSRLLDGIDVPTLVDAGSAIAAPLSNGATEFELLDSQEIRVANHSAIRLDGRSAVADGLFLVIDHGEGNIVAVTAMTSLGTIDQFEETVLAVAASIAIEPAQPSIIQAHSDYIKAIAFSPNSALIASASNDHTTRVWDVATGAKVFTLEHDNWVNAVAFSPNGMLIITGGVEGFGGVVRVWDAATGELVADLVQTAYVTSVAFSPDGALIASGTDTEDDKSVHLWAFDGAWEEIAILSGHTDGVQAVAFSPDGALLASASKDGTARVWDIATGAEVLKLEHPDYVNGIAFSPDGALIVSGSDDGSVHLWDAATGESVAELTGHTNGVTSVAFSPDGALIASGSRDKTVRLWSFDGTGQELAILKGHTDWVRTVAFSPDGALIASGSDDGSVILWDVPR